MVPLLRNSELATSRAASRSTSSPQRNMGLLVWKHALELTDVPSSKDACAPPTPFSLLVNPAKLLFQTCKWFMVSEVGISQERDCLHQILLDRLKIHTKHPETLLGYHSKTWSPPPKKNPRVALVYSDGLSCQVLKQKKALLLKYSHHRVTANASIFKPWRKGVFFFK